jgi:hypothetical protein
MTSKTRTKILNLILVGVIAFGLIAAAGIELEAASRLPVKSPESKGYKKRDSFSVDCFLTVDTIQSCIMDGNKVGLLVDLDGIRSLLDGTVIKPEHKFLGTVYLGPYPFEKNETSYTYKRFRMTMFLQNSKALLPVGYFLEGYHNSEGWTDSGELAMRLHLYLQTDQGLRSLGLYDTVLRFGKVMDAQGNKKYIKKTTIIDGPAVNLITSDDPSTMVVSFKTDRPVKGKVVLEDKGEFEDTKAVKTHEIKVTDLEADTEYFYSVAFEDFETKAYSFRTAPKPGKGAVTFAYCGDSRAGEGGGANNLMGVNYLTMERLANLAYLKGAALFVFGGDLINGYTTSPGDFETQMMGWKQAMAGFRLHRPVYSCIGNHEALLRAFVDKNGYALVMDRWPYETESTEAVFARELVQPENGPTPSDPRRPTYKENVYSFQYGPVRFISFNNNYWVTRNLAKREGSWRTGGAPEGYILDDQMEWIEAELAKAEKDQAVKYIIMYAQEPVFPNGGHIQDSMWYKGDNAVRAYVRDETSGKLKAEKAGIIDVRNRLISMISKNRKVAAVLGSDEHSYHKVLIHRDVPIGVPALDEKGGSRRVCTEKGTCSPLKELKYPTWYLVSGGGGAPYYSKETTPWNTYWLNRKESYPNHTSMRGCFYYSSQENMFIFKADADKISLTVFNPYGEVIDKIDNLMKVKTNGL